MSVNRAWAALVALGRHARVGRPAVLRQVLCWSMILVTSAVLQACEQAPPGRGGELSAAGDNQAEIARLREFVDLLHREIEQLHKDKQRLTEEVGRLRRENAALRAGAGKQPAVAGPEARPASGAPPG